MGSFVKDVSYMGPLQGVCAGPRDRYSKCLAIVHAAVPCKEELVGTKSTAIPVTIVKFLSEGFSSAPYTMAKKGAAPPPQNGVKSEPLFHLDTSKNPSELGVWSYVSKGMNRGPRESGVQVEGGPSSPPMFVLGTGTTFVMFVNSLTFQSASVMGVLPPDTDWIPALSLVEISIAPRHIDSCLSGRGINVKTMRVSETEIDALFQRGVESIGMPSSSSEASRRGTERRDLYPALLKDIEVEKVSFVVPAASIPGSYMGDIPLAEKIGPVTSQAGVDEVPSTPPFIKLVVGTGSVVFPSCEYVDIPLSAIQKQTNTRSPEHACAMLDVALAMGAVHLWVICDDRWANRGDASCYRAVPVLDTTILFGSLDYIRNITTDHAMVAQMVDGVILKDSDGAEILQKIELVEDDDESESGSDDSDGLMLVLPTGVEYDDGFLDLTVKLTEEDLSKTKPSSVLPQSNVALAICGPGMHTSKGYAFQFGVRCATNPLRDVPRIVHGYINRAPAGSGGVGQITRKRKAITMRS